MGEGSCCLGENRPSFGRLYFVSFHARLTPEGGSGQIEIRDPKLGLTTEEVLPVRALIGDTLHLAAKSLVFFGSSCFRLGRSVGRGKVIYYHSGAHLIARARDRGSSTQGDGKQKVAQHVPYMGYFSCRVEESRHYTTQHRTTQ